jgi:hypothetical protein
MKNLLFWLYVVIAIVLIALGYTYWESKVTDSEAQDDVVAQSTGKDSSTADSSKKDKKEDASKPNKDLFKSKEFQKIYNTETKDGKKMNITLVSTPYQTSEENTSVKDELESSIDDHIRLTDLEVAGVSTAVTSEDIYDGDPDLIVLDALTLNDFFESVPLDNHINTLENIYNDVEQNDIPVVIIGTRREYDNPDFNDYQKAEEDYFGNKDNNFRYVSQSGDWPDDETISDDYNVDEGLLTTDGVDLWTTAISDYLFK